MSAFDDLYENRTDDPSDIDLGHLAVPTSPVVATENSVEPEAELESAEAELDEPGSAQTGGNGASGAPASGATADPTSPATELEPAADTAAAAAPEASLAEDSGHNSSTQHSPATEPVISEDAQPSSLTHTDQQDAIQSEAMTQATKGGNSGTGTEAEVTKFTLAGRSKPPSAKYIPTELTDLLKSKIKEQAKAEFGLDDAQWAEFAHRLGPSRLITAFLVAKLDLRLQADETTTKLVQLFQTIDPLLGSLVKRLEDVERNGRAIDGTLMHLRDDVRAVGDRTDVVEQGISYLITDRIENISRDIASVDNVMFTHKSTLRMRDKARDDVSKQRKIERDRDGRPIR